MYMYVYIYIYICTHISTTLTSKNGVIEQDYSGNGVITGLYEVLTQRGYNRVMTGSTELNSYGRLRSRHIRTYDSRVSIPGENNPTSRSRHLARGHLLIQDSPRLSIDISGILSRSTAAYCTCMCWLVVSVRSSCMCYCAVLLMVCCLLKQCLGKGTL